MSDKPKAMESEQPQGNAIEDIRGGFEEIYGNMEGFSKRAVESLFDDDKGDDLLRPSSASPGSFGREADPDDDYRKYIRTAEQANRAEQEKQRADKARAIMDRDEKLGDFSMVPNKWDSGPKSRSYGDGGLKASVKAGRRINVRNMAVVVGILVLAVGAVLTWQIISANAALAAAQERIEELAELETDFELLRIANEGLSGQVNHYRAENANLLSALEMWQNTVTDIAGGGSPDEANGADEINGEANVPETPQAPPTPGDLPYTTIDAAGNRIYVVQPGDSLWAIAARIYGDGGRFRDILAANNMTEADAQNILAGAILIIPD